MLTDVYVCVYVCGGIVLYWIGIVRVLFWEIRPFFPGGHFQMLLMSMTEDFPNLLSAKEEVEGHWLVPLLPVFYSGNLSLYCLNHLLSLYNKGCEFNLNFLFTHLFFLKLCVTQLSYLPNTDTKFMGNDSPAWGRYQRLVTLAVIMSQRHSIHYTSYKINTPSMAVDCLQ